VAFIDTKFYVSDFAERTIKVDDAATGAFESDLVADVGANPTYFIAIVPEPSHGIFAAVALACLACQPRSARICASWFLLYQGCKLTSVFNRRGDFFW